MISHADALGQRTCGGLAGVRGSGDGKRDVRGGLSGAAGVSIAGGARERGLIVVGCDGGGEDAAGGVGESDALGAGICMLARFFERARRRGRRLVRSWGGRNSWREL